MTNHPKTALGLDENIAALLCYAAGWITGFIFLILEKQNLFVRFHALQSLTVFLLLFVVSATAGFIPIVGLAVAALTGPLSVFLWLLLMYKAYSGEKYKLPWIGDWVERQLPPS